MVNQHIARYFLVSTLCVIFAASASRGEERRWLHLIIDEPVATCALTGRAITFLAFCNYSDERGVNMPLDDVLIEIFTSDGAKRLVRRTTNQDGEFTLVDLGPGTYRMKTKVMRFKVTTECILNVTEERCSDRMLVFRPRYVLEPEKGKAFADLDPSLVPFEVDGHVSGSAPN